MSYLIKHDSFDRGAYRRFTLAQVKDEIARFSCAWCGQKPARLFNYQWESDAAYRETYAVGPWFCNFPCHNSYHN